MSMPSFDPGAAAASDSGIYGLPHSNSEAAVVLIPVPFEATTSYGGGTSEGPRAVLEASRQVDLFDGETGRPYERGISMLPIPNAVLRLNEEAKQLAKPVIAAASNPSTSKSNVADALLTVNALCDGMNRWVYEQSSEWLRNGKLVGAVGGDHSISFGCIRAHAERYPGMGVLHLDAHADLRRAYEGFVWSHASIMFNVVDRLPDVSKLVQVGIRDFSEEENALIEGSGGRIRTHFDHVLQHQRFEGVPWNRQVEAIVADLPKDVYLSFDIDGLDPVLCPSTGTPVPGGLSFPEACALIGGVVRSGRRIVGLDLTEVAPGGSDDQWDGNVGARLLYKMIGWMLKSQRAG